MVFVLGARKATQSTLTRPITTFVRQGPNLLPYPGRRMRYLDGKL